ncbi:PREDICTED: F-box/kelch-repeat protein At2g22030-like [Camelina sativa]|uniref:F-box/kelch-repeat protein At2g22030-like n=1 Tax=Camelina sativa TaxID=90675 RepID=A0ABM0TUB9_CAMSA|nr:PREDICTED: F-box/kelch-repeat protein At2g22030-like [Camelina sativa]
MSTSNSNSITNQPQPQPQPPQENTHRASLSSFVSRLLTGLLSVFLLPCRRALSFISGNPKPCEIVSSATALPTDDQSSYSLFSSFPDDIVLNCLARVPRRYYPTISGVSRHFRSLVRSPELADIRSLVSRDNVIFYVCFMEYYTSLEKCHWFTLNPNDKETGGILNSVEVLSKEMLYSTSSVSIGYKIYFVGGSSLNPSSGLWIFDSWSGQLCEGPRMKVARSRPGVAVIDEKIYVMGGCYIDEIQVEEVFDPKTQTWDTGPYKMRPYRGINVAEVVALEGKVYCMMSFTSGNHIIYDPKDCSCETFKTVTNEAIWRRGALCVINSVIYYYNINRGIMWFDSKDKVWREVKGFDTLDKKDVMVGMADCNGKLGFLWGGPGAGSMADGIRGLWFAMIALDRSGVEIHATVERSHLVGSVPNSYGFWSCLSVSY